ncbi:MAG: hypothetical protein IKW34_03530 [Clostridia bacterium]|nr:hypothetical protein [Clostridia bacterium]
MKNAVKIIALLLCVTLLFSACGGNKPTPDESTTENPQENVSSDNGETAKGDGVISLPYNESDGVNPYFVKSNENIYICKMLFNSLFTVDEKYNIVPQIATSISVNGTTATVQLRTDAKCRGSQPINAYDVVYSFNLAKASYAWAGYLNGVASATAKSKFTVEFALDFSDVYVGAKLCFPITKEGTADIQTAVPTGSGEYYWLEKQLVNTADNSKKIKLYTIDTNKSSENAFKIGATDVFFSDLSDCEYIGVAGKTEEVTLNNMVYIGLNSNNGALNKYIRSAIAAQLNSEDVAVSSYQGHGKAVKMPVNPNASIYKDVQSVSAQGDTTLAQKIIDRCGYTRFSGKARTNGAYLLSFNLIVNKDNKYRVAAAYNIADNLNKIGFYVNVSLLSFADYNQRIAAGNYDMYLGEVKLDGSMDLSRFFNGNLSAGIDKTGKAATEYFRYRAGLITAEEYYKIFSEEYPFVPVLFRNGYSVTSADVKTDLSKNPLDLYKNF